MAKSAPSKPSNRNRIARSFLRVAGALFFSLGFLYSAMLAVYAYRAELEMQKAVPFINTAEYQKAELPTRLSIRFNPQSGYAHYYRAAYLAQAGKNQEALHSLEKSLRTTAHPATVLRLMADTEWEEKKYAFAAEHFNQALIYDPAPRVNQGKVWLNFGHAAQLAGYGGEALSAFRRAIYSVESSPVAGPNLGFLFAWFGAPDAAAFEYLYAVSKYPILKERFPDWALGLKTSNMNDFGAKLFAQLDAKSLLDARGLCLRASFHISTKDYDEALRILERAEKMNPNEANVYLLFGEIHYLKGEKDAMRRMYGRFLQMMPNAPQRNTLE